MQKPPILQYFCSIVAYALEERAFSEYGVTGASEGKQRKAIGIEVPAHVWRQDNMLVQACMAEKVRQQMMHVNLINGSV